MLRPVRPEPCSLPSSGAVAPLFLTEEVWQLIFRFLSARELLRQVVCVCRHFFHLVVGEVAAATHFWREAWLTHLAAPGGSRGSGGLMTLLQSVVFPKDPLSACGRVDVPAKLRAMNFSMDRSALAPSSSLVFSVPPAQLSYLTVTLSEGGEEGYSERGLESAAFPSGRSVVGSRLGSRWRQLQREAVSSCDTTRGRTDAFMRLLAEDLIGASTDASLSETPKRSCTAEKEAALQYCKALSFLLPDSRPRCLLEGPLTDVVRISIFAADNTRRDGTQEDALRKGVELAAVLQQSWEALYSAQLTSSATGVCEDSLSSAADPPPAMVGRGLTSGNALFDINVLLTRRQKRTDVYQAIVNHMHSRTTPGLGLFFPVCTSPEALVQWRRSWVDESLQQRRGEQEKEGRCTGDPGDGVALVHQAQGSSSPPRRSRRLIAEEEERIVMTDGGWAAPRRYILPPFYEDNESDSSEREGAERPPGSGFVEANSGRTPAGEADGNGNGDGDGSHRRPPRLSSAQKAKLYADQLARRARRFLLEEDEVLYQGAVHGSLCVDAKRDSLPTEEPPDFHGSAAKGGCEKGKKATEEGGWRRHNGDEAGSSGSETTLPIEVHSDADSHPTVSFHTDDLGEVSGGSDPGSAAVSPDDPRQGENGSEGPRRASPLLGQLGEGSTLNGILAPGALDLRSPTNHRAPSTPTFTPPVPFLFPLPHIATYLYLLQHTTFSDVYHHVWEPNEMKSALCAHIVSPTGDCVETRFFFSYMGGSYPRLYMKLTFSPGDLPHSVFLQKMDQPTEALHSSSSSTFSSRGSDSEGDREENPSAAAEGGPASAVAAKDRRGGGGRGGPQSASQTPLTASAFPLSFHLPTKRRGKSGKQRRTTATRKAAEDPYQAALARRRQNYRHQSTLDFNAMVDIFCGGFGRVEVDIPPSVSRKGLDILRTVLGLDESFPMSLLWNVVAYATGLGPKLWEMHLASFLYHYKMTFTDAVERAFGLRECYGPLNGLRPREFADPYPAPHPPSATAENSRAAATAAASTHQGQGPVHTPTPTMTASPTAPMLPPMVPVTVSVRPFIDDAGSDALGSSTPTAAPASATSSERSGSEGAEDEQEGHGTDSADEHSGDFSNSTSSLCASQTMGPAPRRDEGSASQLASIQEVIERMNTLLRQRRLERRRDSDSDSDSEPRQRE